MNLSSASAGSPEASELAQLRMRIGSLGTKLAWIAAFLFLLVAWRVYTTLWPGVAPTPANPLEYRVEAFSDDEWASAARGPNRLGAEGWEIIYVRRVETGSKSTYECILRRRK